MRQLVLDTETTGLEPEAGHRIIEIGCVELVNRRATDRAYHQYFSPEREIDDGALNVHGITSDFLKDKPRFADVAGEFLEFVRGTEVIIHNAPFDIAFIDAELRRLGQDWGGFLDYCTVLDTLKLARELHPGQRNSLDALCKRYQVDNSQRQFHGALLDAGILADVYLAMTGGQASLRLDREESRTSGGAPESTEKDRVRPRLLVIEPSDAEIEAHDRRLRSIDEASGGNCLWMGNKKNGDADG